MRIVADHKIPFLKGALEGVARVVYLPGNEITREDLLDADALITRTRTRCDRSLLEGTKVSFIASATIGYDHIDTAYCEQAGITWTNAPGCNSASVRQYLVSILLYLASEKELKLKGSTLGVVGVGNVGSKVAGAAEALGMKVLLNDPPRARREGVSGFVTLDELLAQSDVISMHVPLNRGGEDNTFHMVNRQFIEKTKKGAVLVNSSRGAVVSEIELIEGIRSRKLSNVILDVFESEPVVNPELMELITLATPHIAGYSLDGKANGTGMSVRALSKHFGLGLDEWQPGDITPPVHDQILGDAASGDLYEILWDLYRQTYDVKADDSRLREHPETFESLRGNYPLRREPQAYSVRLFQGNEEIREIIEALGFSMLADHCA
ncbi:MAG: 4-phosphoerythronate dehydrogenase PdxB [Bacteroidetes bacterium]|nr:4-phosphoerythronate dehydrogenase PdxB [Bacteroidota bacterium]